MKDAALAKALIPHLRVILELCEDAVKGESEEVRSKAQHLMKFKENVNRIKDLRKAIMEALRGTPNLTTGELATALYTDDMGISFDLFKRRIIVHVSAMHKRKDLWTYKPPGAKETRWHLNQHRYGETPTK